MLYYIVSGSNIVTWLLNIIITKHPVKFGNVRTKFEYVLTHDIYLQLWGINSHLKKFANITVQKHFRRMRNIILFYFVNEPDAHYTIQQRI